MVAASVVGWEQRTHRGLVTQSDTTAADKADIAFVNTASSLEGGNPSRSRAVVSRCLTKLYTYIHGQQPQQQTAMAVGCRHTHSKAAHSAGATHTHREVQRPEKWHDDCTGGVPSVEACAGAAKGTWGVGFNVGDGDGAITTGNGTQPTAAPTVSPTANSLLLPYRPTSRGQMTVLLLSLGSNRACDNQNIHEKPCKQLGG